MLLLAGCGVESFAPQPEIISPRNPESPKRAVLIVFAAPWCSACKVLLPQVQDELNKVDATGVEFELHVTTGKLSNSSPTQEIAQAYRDYLGLSARAFIDDKWKLYRKLVGGNLAIPAAAVLDSEGRLIRSFPAGASFVPQEIVRTVLRKN